MNTQMLSICIVFIFGLLTSCIPTNALINTPSTEGLASPTPIILITTLAEIAIPPLVSVPTLAADDAFSILRNYLKNKPPCQLPCWGGITPGKSTLSDVQKQLTTFSGIADRIYYGQAGASWIVGNLDIDFVEENTVIGIRSSYLASSSNDTILSVSIDTGSYPKSTEGSLYGDKNYDNLLLAYTLPQIVSTYGLPARTFMTAEIYVAEATAPDYFVIRLFYPDLGIFVRYRMLAETLDNNYKFCPSQSVVYLDLIQPGHSNDYKDFFKQRGNLEWSPASLDMPFYKSTEEALGITNEEFYRLIVSSPNRCLKSPINIWPEP